MIRAIFYLILITLLVVYVPDNTRKELKNIIAFVYNSGHKIVKETFSEGQEKPKDPFTEATYTNPQQIYFPLENKKVKEYSEKTNMDGDSKETINEDKSSSDHKQFRTFYKNNRNKLVELMNILGKSNNDKDE